VRQPIPRVDSVAYLPPSVRAQRRMLMLALYSLESSLIAGRDPATGLRLNAAVDEIRAAVEALLAAYVAGRTTPARAELSTEMREPIPRLVFPRLPDRQQFLRAMVRVDGHLVWVLAGSADLAPVPTLLDLVRDLGKIETLPRAQAIALFRDVVVLEALLRAHLLTLSTMPAEPAPPPSEDRLLNADETAARLGVKVSWLYRHGRSLPFVRSLSKKAQRYSEQGLQKYLALKRP